MSNFDDDNTQEPLDPALERVQARLKGLLLGSTLIMVVGLCAVIGAIIFKINQSGDEETSRFQVPDSVTDANLRRLSHALPANSRPVATTLHGDMMAITYQNAKGGGVLLVDIQSWQVHSVLTLPAAP